MQKKYVPVSTISPSADDTNCPLVTGLRPCMCDLPRCPECNYTKHDAQFEGDHHICPGTIPEIESEVFNP
jgi:hypothetical protein